VNEYYDYFGPDYKLDVRSSNMEDRNSIEYLERIKNVVMEHLREIGGPPSVQMSEIPRVPMFDDVDPNENEDMSNPNERPRMQLWEKKARRDDELTDSEDEGEGGRRFEKDRSMKTSPSSKKLSGEVSMDISKAPSPTAGSTGADGVAGGAALEGAGLGLSLDTPGTPRIGGIGDMATEVAEVVPRVAQAVAVIVGSTEAGLSNAEAGMGDDSAKSGNAQASHGDGDVEMIG